MSSGRGPSCRSKWVMIIPLIHGLLGKFIRSGWDTVMLSLVMRNIPLVIVANAGISRVVRDCEIVFSVGELFFKFLRSGVG